MQMRLLQCAFIALSASIASAHAGEIIVQKAAVEAGKTIITGYTSNPTTSVSIVGSQYSVKSIGPFTFELAWLPPSCAVKLYDGTVYEDVVIANCGPRGLTGAPGPAGPMGPKGDDGFAHYGQLKTSQLWIRTKSKAWQFEPASSSPILLTKGSEVIIGFSFGVRGVRFQNKDEAWFAGDEMYTSDSKFKVSPCLKSKDGKILVGYGGHTVLAQNPHSLEGQNKIAKNYSSIETISIKDGGSYQVGACFKYNTNGYWLVIHSLTGFWIAP
jgi:hypothetical protein